MPAESLVEYLRESAARWPGRVAVVDPSGTTLSYAELDDRVDRLARFLASRGVRPGDRVGVVLPKTIDSVTALFAIMRAGAAYVPIDVTAPAERGQRILADCGVRAVIRRPSPDRRPGLGEQDPVSSVVDFVVDLSLSPDRRPGLVELDPAAIRRPGLELQDPVSLDHAIATAGPAIAVRPNRSDLAYILYTSGSTGMPKGVMLSHENALSFVDWCSTRFHPDETDRFSSHAPFHFDLSVFDIYVAIKHGASLHLISETVGKNPKELARFIAERRLTIWYSTPSILTLLLQFGGITGDTVPDLRLVLFAGEVFPVKHLRDVQRLWPKPAYFNLYGPTETNVCTFAAIPRVPDDRDTPYPIGFACDHCEARVLDDEGREVKSGEEGLLYIRGASVFQGYWNRPAENAAAFLERADGRWYNTGDLVRWDAEGGFTYGGRKDRMVKRRGYRIELGEIERALYLEPRISEAAVVAVPDSESGVRIVAFVACAEGPAPSIVELKTFCGRTLPAYMSPDRFVVENRLPRTSTDKVDYQTLRTSALEPGAGVRSNAGVGAGKA